MREVKIRFICFSDYFWKLWLRQGCISFYGSHKGDEEADTDLMFQFCLPIVHSFHGFNISTNASSESRAFYQMFFFKNWHLKNFLHCYSRSQFLWGVRLWQFDTRVLRKYLMERNLLSRSKSRSLWSHYSQLHASLDFSTVHPKNVHASKESF